MPSLVGSEMCIRDKPVDISHNHIPLRYLLYIWKNKTSVTITAKIIPNTVTTPKIPRLLIVTLCRIFPTFAVEPEANTAIIQVSKKNPATMETTSIISGFASPTPSIGLEPLPVKSVSFNSAADAVLINTMLKSKTPAAERIALFVLCFTASPPLFYLFTCEYPYLYYRSQSCEFQKAIPL